MKFIKPAIDFLIFSNLFVAFAFATLACQTFTLINFEINYSLVFFIFCSSFFVYSFHRWFGIINLNDDGNLPFRLRWIKDHKKHMVMICMMALPLMLFSSFELSVSHLIAVIPVGIISLGYTIPVIPGNGQYLSLREITGVKSIVIAFVISSVTVFLPSISARQEVIIKDTEILFIFFERFLFIFCLSIPFDIRDINFDKSNMTKTIPVMFGEKRARMVSQFALFLCSGICILHFFSGEMKTLTMVAYLISLSISGILIFFSTQSRNEYFFSFGVDGLMVIQTLLVILSN